MKTTHLFALVAVLTVAGVSSARAGEWGGDCHRGGEWGGEWNYFDHADAFCKEHGVKFSHGYFYPGLVQKHFTEKWFDEYFKVEMQFDPHTHCPYYFCAGHGVWYPIHYIEKVGPGAKGPGPMAGKPGPGPAPGGPAPGGPAPGGSAPDGGGTPAPNGPAVVPNGTPNVAPPAGNGTPAGPQGAVAPAPSPPAGGNTNSPPPEPTSSDAGRVARVVPTGTFEDAIPDPATK